MARRYLNVVVEVLQACSPDHVNECWWRRRRRLGGAARLFGLSVCHRALLQDCEWWKNAFNYLFAFKFYLNISLLLLPRQHQPNTGDMEGECRVLVCLRRTNTRRRRPRRGCRQVYSMSRCLSGGYGRGWFDPPAGRLQQFVFPHILLVGKTEGCAANSDGQIERTGKWKRVENNTRPISVPLLVPPFVQCCGEKVIMQYRTEAIIRVRWNGKTHYAHIKLTRMIRDNFYLSSDEEFLANPMNLWRRSWWWMDEARVQV